jgi:hypothetical protein
MHHGVAVMLFGLTLAATAYAAPKNTASAAEALPLPPIPPLAVPGYEAAPLPDSEARAPQDLTPQGIELVPRLYRRPATTTGLGYTPGSAFREPESERLNRLGPGFNLRVPLN